MSTITPLREPPTAPQPCVGQAPLCLLPVLHQPQRLAEPSPARPTLWPCEEQVTSGRRAVRAGCTSPATFGRTAPDVSGHFNSTWHCWAGVRCSVTGCPPPVGPQKGASPQGASHPQLLPLPVTQLASPPLSRSLRQPPGVRSLPLGQEKKTLVPWETPTLWWTCGSLREAAAAGWVALGEDPFRPSSCPGPLGRSPSHSSPLGSHCARPALRPGASPASHCCQPRGHTFSYKLP